MIKLSKFLKDRRKTILLLIFAILTTQIFLLIYEIHPLIRLYTALIVLFCYFLGILLEYEKEKKFYEDLRNKLEEVEEKYLIVEMLQKPNFLEGEILKEVLEDTNKSMLEHVDEYKQRQEEYKEYIELWIHEIKLPIATSHMILENNPGQVSENLEEELIEMEDLVEQVLFYARSNTVEKDYYITKCNLKSMIFEVMKRNKKVFLESKIRY